MFRGHYGGGGTQKQGNMGRWVTKKIWQIFDFSVTDKVTDTRGLTVTF